MSTVEMIPPRTAFASQRDWLSAVAETIDVKEETLRAISGQLATWSHDRGSGRTALRAALKHHNNQAEVSRRAAVRICVSPKDAVDPRYEYKNGTHLLSTVTESMKQEAGAVATGHGLDILTQGPDYISLGEGKVSVDIDTTVASEILYEVFGVHIEEIPAVIEHLPDGGTRHWVSRNSINSRSRDNY